MLDRFTPEARTAASRAIAAQCFALARMNRWPYLIDAPRVGRTTQSLITLAIAAAATTEDQLTNADQRWVIAEVDAAMRITTAAVAAGRLPNFATDSGL